MRITVTFELSEEQVARLKEAAKLPGESNEAFYAVANAVFKELPLEDDAAWEQFSDRICNTFLTGGEKVG